jgi:hypothetical protein
VVGHLPSKHEALSSIPSTAHMHAHTHRHTHTLNMTNTHTHTQNQTNKNSNSLPEPRPTDGNLLTEMDTSSLQNQMEMKP